MQHTSFPAAEPSAASRAPRSSRWRVVDIVVASVVGVALGVVFFVWGFAYSGLETPLKALLPGVQARIVNLRTAAIGRRPRFDLAALAPGEGASLERARLGSRPVWFAGGWRDTAIHARLDLPVGARIAGPAILEQPDATIVVDPGLSARVDPLGNVVIERG